MSLGLLIIAVPTLAVPTLLAAVPTLAVPTLLAAPAQVAEVSSAKESDAKTHQPATRHRRPSNGPRLKPQGRTKACPEGMTPAQKWKAADLLGFRLSLDDGKRMISFLFGEEGRVAAGFRQRDGSVTAPLLKWWIDRGGQLNIEDVGRLRKQCAGDHGFIVDLNGAREEFGREKL